MEKTKKKGKITRWKVEMKMDFFIWCLRMHRSHVFVDLTLTNRFLFFSLLLVSYSIRGYYVQLKIFQHIFYILKYILFLLKITYCYFHWSLYTFRNHWAKLHFDKIYRMDLILCFCRFSVWFWVPNRAAICKIYLLWEILSFLDLYTLK